ncbi:helix-turn-helix domain-containing protein [Sphingomonas sanguinis]|uniref:helix-turn-helix domain-containing protein n=1 Tax=Sphingomonas sp. LC-1 TaxID=3110957 RepID=UPI0021BA62D7|nr:helix-turn-helix domain-containing protein [Sphingomonas sp. LC-1]MCT8002413.1 helix-turn-helix domain-containing protein [Sphingomonas sp. LC-1]
MKDIREPAGAITTRHPLTVTVKVALAMIGIGRTRFYELVAAGQITTVKIGRRRLVHVESLQRLAAEGYVAAPPYMRPEQIDLDL